MFSVLQAEMRRTEGLLHLLRMKSLHGILIILCYENKTRSQKLNLDNKCFQQL